MKVVLVSTSDKGGAGKSALRLHLGLLAINIDSHILFLKQYDKSIPNSHEFISELGNKSINKAMLGFRYYRNKLSLVGREFAPEIFSYIDTNFDLSKHPLIQSADIINLHWLAHFLDWKSFFSKINKPIIWTLHDQNLFTGGCHYSFDCNRYRTNCDECPQLKGTFLNKSSLYQQTKKQEILNKINNLTIVTPSKWLGSLSRQSLISKNIKHEVINYSIEHEKFIAFNKDEARKELNLPTNKKILLFVADDINREYKGVKLLIKALKKIGRDDYILCSIGKGDFPEKLGNHFSLGFINDTKKISLVYSAADVFITPSLQDNFPNTVLESQMCGTPVIGFPVCGVEEMIEHKINGILCEKPTYEYLSQSIELFLDNKITFDNKIIRKNAEKKYNFTKSPKNYVKLYKKILNSINS
jgi:glycosyltransferase involved in cell wall biosynthesis